MPTLIGTPQPVFPATGYFHGGGESFAWQEFNLDHWNLYHTLTGSGVCWGDWGELHLGAGSLLLLPPGLGRSYRIEIQERGWDFFWMHFRPDRCLRAHLDWWDRSPGGRLIQIPAGRLREHTVMDLEELHRLQMGLEPGRLRTARVAALLQTLLLRAAEVASDMTVADAAIGQVLEQLHRDLAAPRDLAGLARDAGLSRSQFCARFQAATGSSPMVYLETRRLEWARFLLQATADGVAAIAARVGYPDPYHFSRRFRAHYGQAPRDLRRPERPRTQ